MYSLQIQQQIDDLLVSLGPGGKARVAHTCDKYRLLEEMEQIHPSVTGWWNLDKRDSNSDYLA